ncbi:MAG: psd [Verrucomicrobiales bacterium]|nr:psd [Verrucomicrobiales bacterium]
MASADKIQFFNRYSGKVETEEVYGEGFLRWTYGNPLGKASLHTLVKRSAFSKWYGRKMNAPASKKKVLPFIQKYGLKAEEFADDPKTFKNFNQFFYRKLKPGARPVAKDQKTAVFPADGRHLGIQHLSEIDGLFVKGHYFDLVKLIKDDQLAKRFADGSMLLSRLCPVDYHRFHFPVDGVASETRQIRGHLYSVNPIALKKNIHIFTQNKRAFCQIDSKEFGLVLMFEIGATCVGSFEYTYKPGQVSKGEEKGFFKFGGSSTITLFEKNRIRLDDDLISNSKQNRELYARMGDHLGTAW